MMLDGFLWQKPINKYNYFKRYGDGGGFLR